MKACVSLGLIICSTTWLGCDAAPGTSTCATPLAYVTNISTVGKNATRNAAQYYAQFNFGTDNHVITALVDTGSANLIINESNFTNSTDSVIGNTPYVYDSGSTKSIAKSASDKLDLGCIENIRTNFSLTEREYPTKNILGLAFSDSANLPHEAKLESFMGQFVQNSQLRDIFSLALCGRQSTSHVLLGGIDDHMINQITTYIPIAEPTKFILPALGVRIKNSDKLLGEFDPEHKTYLDSASAFLFMPTKIAKDITSAIKKRALELGYGKTLMTSYFNTGQYVPTTTVRFASEAHINKFPHFEITFTDISGETQALALSPTKYFKQVHKLDPMIRTYAIRETEGDIILGQPFMENHYLVFDRANLRVGFGDINLACAKN